MWRLLALLPVAVACAQRSETSPVLRSHDQAVYQAVLDSLFVRGAPSGITQLIFRSRTSVHRGGAGVFEHFYRLPGVDTAVVRDLEARSRAPHSLGLLRSLRLRIPVVLAEDQGLNSLPSDLDHHWSEFYRRYAGSSGLISLSSIGYDPRFEVAILMVYQECGVACGNGYLVALRRVGDTWRIVATEATPVS